MKRVIYTVTPCAGGWEVRGPGALHGPVYRTKAAAVAQGRSVARAARPVGQLRIKGRNGRIQTEHTYGNDPRRHVG